MEALPNGGIDPINKKPVKRSNTWLGWNTIYGREGEHHEPYMTRIWIGRLRMHIFYRGDNDPDHHDHPWHFWTFPLTSYVEEVLVPAFACPTCESSDPSSMSPEEFAAYSRIHGQEPTYQKYQRIVPAFRWSFRPATHCHRVLGRYSGNIWHQGLETIIENVSPDRANRAINNGWSDQIKPYFDERKIVTIVWRGGEGRKWGFLKSRDGKWCWVHWKDYVFAGGKDSPCQ